MSARADRKAIQRLKGLRGPSGARYSRVDVNLARFYGEGSAHLAGETQGVNLTHRRGSRTRPAAEISTEGALARGRK